MILYRLAFYYWLSSSFAATSKGKGKGKVCGVRPHLLEKGTSARPRFIPYAPRVLRPHLDGNYPPSAKPLLADCPNQLAVLRRHTG